MLEVSLVTTPWVKTADRMPDKSCECVIIVQNKNWGRYTTLAYYDKKHRRFEWYDYCDDGPCYYYKKDVFAWLEIPDYKNL